MYEVIKLTSTRLVFYKKKIRMELEKDINFTIITNRKCHEYIKSRVLPIKLAQLPCHELYKDN